MSLNELESPGQSTLNQTMALGRMIADLCLTSGLKTAYAVDCAIDIARSLIRANAEEHSLDSKNIGGY